MLHLRLAPDGRRVDRIGSYQVCLTSVIRYSRGGPASQSSHLRGIIPICDIRIGPLLEFGWSTRDIREWTDMECRCCIRWPELEFRRRSIRRVIWTEHDHAGASDHSGVIDLHPLASH